MRVQGEADAAWCKMYSYRSAGYRVWGLGFRVQGAGCRV